MNAIFREAPAGVSFRAAFVGHLAWRAFELSHWYLLSMELNKLHGARLMTDADSDDFAWLSYMHDTLDELLHQHRIS